MDSASLPHTHEQPAADRGLDERRARLRDTLIENAWTLLSTEGLAAMQARRVAQMSGCSVGAIYNLFPDLDDLILRANARALDHIASGQRAALAALPPSASLREILGGLAGAYMRFALDEETAWRSLFDYRLTYRKPYPDWYRDAQVRAFGVLSKALADRPEAEARRLLETLWAAVHGVISAGLDQRLHARSDDEIAAQVGLVVDMAARSLEAGRA